MRNSRTCDYTIAATPIIATNAASLYQLFPIKFSNTIAPGRDRCICMQFTVEDVVEWLEEPILFHSSRFTHETQSPFKIVAGFGVVRIDPQGLMIMVNGLLELAAFLQRYTQVIMRPRPIG